MSPEELKDLELWEDELPELPPFIDEALKLEWEIYTYEKPASHGRVGDFLVTLSIYMACALVIVLFWVGVISLALAAVRHFL